MQRQINDKSQTIPKVDTKLIEGQLGRLRELFVMEDITRQEYVGRKRELEASLQGGPEQPSFAEAVLVRAARLLNDLGQLWARATDDERTEIARNLFVSVRCAMAPSSR